MAKTVKVMQLKNKQKLITLPAVVCEAYQLEKGTKLSFSFIHKQGKIAAIQLRKEE